MLVLGSNVLRTPWRRLRRLLVPASTAVVMLAALSAQAQAQDQADSPSLTGTQVLDAFDTAAFGPADRPDPHLYRWPSDTQVTVG